MFVAPRHQEDLPPSDARWARDPYPDYVAEVNRSIAFSGAKQDFFIAGKAKRLIDLLRRRGQDPAATRLLDIGCGVGLLHPPLMSELAAVVGVDVAADALASARAANPGVRYEAYDGAHLPFENEAFDAAVAICVMHHVPPTQWEAFVAEAFRIVRPGGLFMVFEHNPWNPLTRLAVARCAFDYDAVLLSPLRLAGLLRHGGFKDVGREFMFFTPFSAAPVQKAEQSLRWCPVGAQYVAFGRRG
ncbi:MAG TPA: methyltransferase domain-containing protein [Roseiarcus sp.]|nr:methyltransferase domain-containing protein [Roseiarcus sp.]